MASEKLTYRDGDTECLGEIFVPEGRDGGPRPAVLVNHAWRGLSDFERGKCEMLAGEGYVAVALVSSWVSANIASGCAMGSS